MNRFKQLLTYAIIGVVVLALAFVGFKLLVFGFYSAPETKIYAVHHEDNVYSIIELNPDKTMELNQVFNEKNATYHATVKYKLTGQSANHIIGPLYVLSNRAPWSAYLWMPESDRKAYVVSGDIVNIIPKELESEKQKFAIKNAVLVVDDEVVIFDGIEHVINQAMPSWIMDIIKM